MSVYLSAVLLTDNADQAISFKLCTACAVELRLVRWKFRGKAPLNFKPAAFGASLMARYHPDTTKAQSSN